MIDSILELRQQKLQESTSKESIKSKTEQNLLSLRKNHMDKYILNRRKEGFIENISLEIDPTQLYFPAEYRIDIESFLKDVRIIILI
jgi:hypothetical protein